MEGYLLVGMGPVVPDGKEGLETEKLVNDKLVGQVADTVGYMPADMDPQKLVDKGWGEDTYLLGFAGSGHHAS